MERRDTSAESILFGKRKEVASGRRDGVCGQTTKGTAEGETSASQLKKGTEIL